MTLDVATVQAVTVLPFMLMGLFLGGAWWIQRTSPALAWWGLAFAFFAGTRTDDVARQRQARHGERDRRRCSFPSCPSRAACRVSDLHGKAVPWGIAAVALAGYAVFTPALDGPAREMVRVAIALSGAITIITLVDLIRWREEPRTWWRIGEAVLLGHLVVLALRFVAGPLLDGDAADTSEQAVDIVLLVAPIVIPIALGTTMLAMVYERRTAALRSDALRDPLTGALNRRGVEHWLAYERQCPRGGRRNGQRAALAVIAVDLDHFKRINDTHGHSVGDAILRTVVSRLSAEVRPADAVARFGGEEFLVLMAWIECPGRAVGCGAHAGRTRCRSGGRGHGERGDLGLLRCRARTGPTGAIGPARPPRPCRSRALPGQNRRPQPGGRRRSAAGSGLRGHTPSLCAVTADAVRGRYNRCQSASEPRPSEATRPSSTSFSRWARTERPAAPRSRGSRP